MPVAAPGAPRYHPAVTPEPVTSDAVYLRPLPCAGDHPRALPLAGGPMGFAEVELSRRGRPPELLPAAAIPALLPDGADRLARLSGARLPVAGLALTRPRVMGVVNVTPDSFSDGGRHGTALAAIGHALRLAAEGADILDIGGESTRPGADPVSEQEELDRVMPVLEGLAAAGCTTPVSIDTRKAAVARAAIAAGAQIFNDVSALTHDPESLAAAPLAPAVCLMHAQGDPRTMQADPRYDDVLRDVHDYLAGRVRAAVAAGVPRARLIVDPGIGFGKRLEHNVALMQGLSMLHGLGCPLLLGVSRKRFLGTLSGVAVAAERVSASVAGALHGAAQGAQILRVHDVAATVQALRVWEALNPPVADRQTAGETASEERA
ncbi:dihydropteroate synthase [Paralimibaculum aggregatum]|uniref:dihydropteroate synthase n=1 Tax=Paralimibaculum aggregatum TaxID=3036245 RepID=A0ABQ6LQA3_9RHOB|nr:dihydropteroate synthase [Limibaculum sp. NKW23]